MEANMPSVAAGCLSQRHSQVRLACAAVADQAAVRRR